MSTFIPEVLWPVLSDIASGPHMSVPTLLAPFSLFSRILHMAMAAGGEGRLPASFLFSSLSRCNRWLAEEQQKHRPHHRPSLLLPRAPRRHPSPPRLPSTAYLVEAHDSSSIADGVRQLRLVGLDLVSSSSPSSTSCASVLSTSAPSSSQQSQGPRRTVCRQASHIQKIG